MSRELRKAMLHRCREYLEKLDQLKALTNTEEDTPVINNGAQSDGASPAEPKQNGRKSDVDLKNTTEEEPGVVTSSTSSETGNSSSSASGNSAHDDTAISIPESSLGPGPEKEVRPPTCPAVIVTTAQLERFKNSHRALASIVASIRKGISRLDKDERSKYNFRWAEAGRLNGERAIVPKRCMVWRDPGTTLRTVMDDGWLWEVEMAEAWEMFGPYHHRDGQKRQLLKL